MIARGNLDAEKLAVKDGDWDDSDMVEEPEGAPHINVLAYALLEAMVNCLSVFLSDGSKDSDWDADMVEGPKAHRTLLCGLTALHKIQSALHVACRECWSSRRPAKAEATVAALNAARWSATSKDNQKQTNQMFLWPVGVLVVQAPGEAEATVLGFRAAGPVHKTHKYLSCDRQGVPVIQAPGEAEATAAALNAAGHADAVATPDGDALLFGARIVYKTIHLSVRLDCLAFSSLEPHRTVLHPLGWRQSLGSRSRGCVMQSVTQLWPPQCRVLALARRGHMQSLVLGGAAATQSSFGCLPAQVSQLNSSCLQLSGVSIR